MNPMRLRRCHALLIEPREVRELDLEALLMGQPRLRSTRRWIALAAHIDDEIELSAEQLAALGDISSEDAVEHAALAERFGTALIDSLVAQRLLLAADDSTEADAPLRSDAAARSGHWRSLAAVMHRHLRWRGVNSEEARTSGALGNSDQEILERLGTPPEVSRARASAEAAQPLPAPAANVLPNSPLRATCRNFDASRRLPLEALATVLHRVYGAQGRSVVSGVPVLKKNSPSAGGLHPVEAYLLVRHVEGLATGLYHYRPDTHALEPLQPLSDEEAARCASLFVAHQPWFVDAHVQVILAARFRRNYWKYRNHAKAYRAVILDSGHLSQMQYLVATELGLGAFITAAVNEGDIEDAFGLDPMQEGVIAVTGFGWRGERMEVLEFDPLKQVWPAWTAEPQG
jgi:putative peptide maturation dehydrogenase